MNVIKNKELIGSCNKKITLDVYWKDDSKPKPMLIFAHGFKGFKDWGHWERIAETFAEAGYCFVKFNFSHNGVTPTHLLDFVDLEAFGQNNYSKELDDLQVVLDWIKKDTLVQQQTNWESDNITLIGHSRGGPIALIAALENEEVKYVITWASVYELDYAWQKTTNHLTTWKKEGVYYVENARTQQQMPLYYQLHENYEANQERFSIQETLKKMDKPYLIIHGSADPAVPISAAEYLVKHALKGELLVIENANHVFGGTHPFKEKILPKHSSEMVEKCLFFLKKKD